MLLGISQARMQKMRLATKTGEKSVEQGNTSYKLLSTFRIAHFTSWLEDLFADHMI
jgi:hypothetical protein